MITQQRLKEVLDYNQDTGILIWKVSNRTVKAGQFAGYLRSDGYIRIAIDRRAYLAHRLVWLFVHGSFPKFEIDHKNLVRNDNRIGNLRDATHSQGMANKGPRRNGLKGVYWNKRLRKWKAQIMKDGKYIYLGLFNTEQEGHDSHMAAAQRLYGEFARAAQ